MDPLHYTAYTARLQGEGVQISVAEVGAAWQNGYVERVRRCAHFSLVGAVQRHRSKRG